MELDGVEATCAWCGRKWLICRSCWRGQRYCCDGCQAAAREVQVDQAKHAYVATAKGRANQQERQRRYRLKLAEAKRTQESVTDQATRGVVADCILDAEPDHDHSRRHAPAPPRSKQSKDASPAGPPPQPPSGHEEGLRFEPAPAGAVCAECQAQIRRILVGPLPLFLSLRGFG